MPCAALKDNSSLSIVILSLSRRTEKHEYKIVLYILRQEQSVFQHDTSASSDFEFLRILSLTRAAFIIFLYHKLYNIAFFSIFVRGSAGVVKREALKQKWRNALA